MLSLMLMAGLRPVSDNVSDVLLQVEGKSHEMIGGQHIRN